MTFKTNALIYVGTICLSLTLGSCSMYLSKRYVKYINPLTESKKAISIINESDTAIVFSTDYYCHSDWQEKSSHVFIKQGMRTKHLYFNEYAKGKEGYVFLDWDFVFKNYDSIRSETINEYTDTLIDSSGKTLFKMLSGGPYHLIKIITYRDTICKTIYFSTFSSNRDKYTYRLVQSIRGTLYNQRMTWSDYKMKRRIIKDKIITK